MIKNTQKQTKLQNIPSDIHQYPSSFLNKPSNKDASNLNIETCLSKTTPIESNMQEHLPKQKTNAFFKRQRNHAQNKTCLLCRTKSPIYTNLTLSCYLCSACAGAQRATYKVKSTIHDLWDEGELTRMYVGGNEFANENGVAGNKDTRRVKEFIKMLDARVNECCDDIFCEEVSEKKTCDVDVQEFVVPRIGKIYDAKNTEEDVTIHAVVKGDVKNDAKKVIKKVNSEPEMKRYVVKTNEYSFMQTSDKKYVLSDVDEERLGLVGDNVEKDGLRKDGKYSYKNVMHVRTYKEEKTDLTKNVKNAVRNVAESSKMAFNNLISKFKK
ncbi:ADP-ribosylation factor GTPase activating protein [Conglomerata obtusa]